MLVIKQCCERLANQAANKLRSAGHLADFSIQSLERLDDLIVDYVADSGHANQPNRTIDGTHFRTDRIALYELGSYVAESLRRKFGGECFIPEPAERQKESFICLQFPNGSWIDPAWALSRRLTDGWSITSFVEAAKTFAEGGLGDFTPVRVRPTLESTCTEGESRDPLSIWHELAELMAQSMRESGYSTDFSVSSLGAVEQIMVEHSRDGKPVPGGCLESRIFRQSPNSHAMRLMGIGVYVGEVLRRRYGGAWTEPTTSDVTSTPWPKLRLPNGTVTDPVGKVFKRLHNGPNDNLVAFGLQVHEAAGCPSPQIPPTSGGKNEA